MLDKIRQFVCLLILLTLVFSISTQAISADYILQTEAASCINSDSLIRLSNKYISVDNEIARMYAEKSRNLTSGGSDKTKLIPYFMAIGQINYYEDKYDESLLYLDSALTLIPENQPDVLAQCYSYKAKTFAVIGNYPEALEACKKSIQFREKTGDIQGAIMCQSLISAIYRNQGDLEKAEEYINAALSKSSNLDNQIAYATILSNISNLKILQDSFPKAYKIEKEAYEIFLSSGNIRRIASSLTNLGNIELQLNKNQDAISKLKESEKLYKKLDEKYGLTTVYSFISQAFYNLNKNDSALKYSLIANQLALEIQSQPLIAQSYLDLSCIYKRLNEYAKALDCYEKYEKLNTEIISFENSKKISNIEHRTQIESKDKDIQILTQNNQIRKQQTLLILIIAGALGILCILAIIALRMKNTTLKQRHELLKNKNQLIENKNKIHEQEKTILENNLELKNKELASKALALMQLNETLKQIGNQINDEGNGKDQVNPGLSKKIMHDIQSASHGNIWKEFDTAFNNVYNDFYKELFKICPDLSSTEIKLAALLKLNLSTKEIAALTFKSESAIKTARHRLRQKLNIGHDGNIVAFLMKL